MAKKRNKRIPATGPKPGEAPETPNRPAPQDAKVTGLSEYEDEIDVPIAMDPSEANKAAQDMAHTQIALDQVRQEKSEASAEINKDIRDLDGTLTELAEQIEPKGGQQRARFSNTEFQELAVKMSKAKKKQDKLKAEKKDNNAEFNQRIKDLSGHMTELSNQVESNTKMERRPVTVIYDPTEQTVTTVRKDLKKGQPGHTTVRDMTAEEKAQAKLPGLKSGNGSSSKDVLEGKLRAVMAGKQPAEFDPNELPPDPTVGG